MPDTAFAIPIGHVVNIRKPSPSVRKLVTFVVPRWQGNRITLEYTNHAHVRVASNGQPRVKLLRLSDGWVSDPEITVLAHREGSRTAERRAAIRGISGTIEPGYAVVVLNGTGRRFDDNTASPTFYLHALTDQPAIQDELDVARDAFQAGNGMDTIRIARRAIPLTAALFMILLEHEAKQLGLAIAQAEYA